MQGKSTSPTAKRIALTPVVANEQFDPTPVLKTIFEQLEKRTPDPRGLDERIMEKSASIAKRLTK